MKKSEVRVIQSVLSEKGIYTGHIDGLRGNQSDLAIHAFLSDQSDGIAGDTWPDWSAARKAVAALQLLCLENDLDAGVVDGFYGPQTEAAAGLLLQLRSSGDIRRDYVDIEPVRENPHGFPQETEQALNDHYGSICDLPLVKIECPWQLRLDWDLTTSVRTISVHAMLGESLSNILEKVYSHYGQEGVKLYGLDRYGGSYNCRKKRGGMHAWSTHAWGIAIDWYPSRNKLQWRSDKASLAHSDLDYWWEAWEQEGWLSLGRMENRDWMHVQAAKR